VAEVVYGRLGFKPEKKTATKLISTDDRELSKVAHPVINDIIEYRRLDKLRGTYVENLLKQSTDGRVRTTLKCTRTDTGRLSSADPNLQNIPTRTADGKRIRQAFVAPPGRLLMRSDFSQQELRLQAHEAQCSEMIKLFEADEDIHARTAMRVFGVSKEDSKKEKFRSPCKNLNFGVIYLITAEGLAENIREYVAELIRSGGSTEVTAMSPDDCQRLIAEWYQLYPEVRNWQQERIAEAVRTGMVRDMFGRIRFSPEVLCAIRSIAESGKRQVVNFPIQGGCATITKVAMRNLYNTRQGAEVVVGGKIDLLMQIHDEVLIEIPDTLRAISVCSEWMQQQMTDCVQLCIPLPVEVKVGRNWAEMKTIDKWLQQ
jgi:DNA polymerase-1